jgi:hypothetical protein
MLTANIIRAFSFCGQLTFRPGKSCRQRQSTKACQVRLLPETTRWGNPPGRDRCRTATGQQPSKAASGVKRRDSHGRASGPLGTANIIFDQERDP